MGESGLGITDRSITLCQTLLGEEQTVLQGSLSRDDIFEKTCPKLQSRNKARVVQDVTQLIVPSAETLATLGATHLESLVESVNEDWENSIPITKTGPHPDFAIAGFLNDTIELIAIRATFLWVIFPSAEP